MAANGMPNIATAADVAINAHDAAQNNIAANPRHLDGTYVREINYFRTWIENQRANNEIPHGARMLTRENVDLYFNTVVTTRSLNHNSARRVVNALQRLADDFEYAGETERFVIDSSQNVVQALAVLDRQHEARERATFSDPHANLPTDMMSEREKINILNHVLVNNKPNWAPFCLSFTGCEQMMTRNDSIRAFVYSDIKYNDTHSPTPSAPFENEMISLIYGKYQHKEKPKSNRVVGAWRHKNWIQDFTGMLAMVLFERHYANDDLNFHRADMNQPAGWWRIPIVQGWDNTQAAVNAYTTIFNEVAVNWSKCTHIRKSGTEYASAIGRLHPDLIATMTKHSTRSAKEKLLSTYMTELHPDVCHVMSGHHLNTEVYCVPRSRVEMSRFEWEQPVVDYLFPQRERWLEEVADLETGDDSKAAFDFLNRTLPFLAKVCVQDGIYWIHHFPNHPVSLLLKHALPADYEHKAGQMRAWVASESARIAAEAVHALPQATQQVVNGLRHDMQESVTLLRQLLHQQQVFFSTQPDPQPPHDPPPPPHDPPPPPALGPNPAPVIRHHLPPARIPLNNVNHVLQRSALKPPITPSLPVSMKHLLNEFRALDLERFEHADKRDWGNLRNQFSKRLYLFRVIKKKAASYRGPATFEEKLDRAAAELDLSRRGRSLAVFLRELKSSDPTRKQRNRQSYRRV